MLTASFSTKQGGDFTRIPLYFVEHSLPKAQVAPGDTVAIVHDKDESGLTFAKAVVIGLSKEQCHRWYSTWVEPIQLYQVDRETLVTEFHIHSDPDPQTPPQPDPNFLEIVDYIRLQDELVAKMAERLLKQGLAHFATPTTKSIVKSLSARREKLNEKYGPVRLEGELISEEPAHKGEFFRFGEGGIIYQQCSSEDPKWAGWGLSIRHARNPCPDLVGDEVPESSPDYRGDPSFSEPKEVMLWFPNSQALAPLLKELTEIFNDLLEEENS